MATVREKLLNQTYSIVISVLTHNLIVSYGCHYYVYLWTNSSISAFF